VGGHACDPNTRSCLYDADQQPYFGLCDVCRIFGATGWARRFRMIVTNETHLQSEVPFTKQIHASRSYVDRLQKSKTPTWFFNSAPLCGSVHIKLITIDQQFQVEVIAGLIQFLADWATIGAKPQMGFGVVNIAERQTLHPLMDHLQHITELHGQCNDTRDFDYYNTLPSLQNMFFSSIRVPERSLTESFNLKYDLRRLFSTNTSLRHFVMGTVQGKPQGAKIMMSRPYNGSIYLWGWIPDKVCQFGTSRADVIKQIYTHLHTTYTLNYWREWNSTYDTTQQMCANPKEFLNSLLKVEERQR
ncbi:MAG: RAMP superfamily CRISPR-associated protein, partial [Ktedonobacteraceae bacterium]